LHLTLEFRYFIIDRRTLKRVESILGAIKSLAVGELVHLEENGTLAEIAVQLNKTSDLLEARSIAQENWIAGVSHDVRTPLSIILGYSEQIEQKETLPEDIREKAYNIKSQSVLLCNLINDLNLVTRLGTGNMAIQPEQFYPACFCRNLLADFLNDVSNDNYSLEIDIDKEMETILIMGVPNLLQRAFYNLLYNSVKHNPNGCNIYFQLLKSDNNAIFIFSDDGEGISVEKFEELQSRPHYLSCNESTLLQQHGLGLYVVQQIVKLHNATISFGCGKHGGFQSLITLPFNKEL
jgi:K+-sensing histidine kinase KdpD